MTQGQRPPYQEDLKMKTSMLRRPRDEDLRPKKTRDKDLHAKKTQRRRPPRLDDLETKASTLRRDEDLLVRKT
jgi:hypothetical protein